MNDYKTEFINALKYTNRKLDGKLDLPFIDSNSKYFNDETFVKVGQHFQNVIADYKYDLLFIDKGCLFFHGILKPGFEEIFNEDILLTIGWFEYDQQSYFKCTEQEFEVLYNGKAKTDKICLHAWLTLPSLEIIDFTGGYSIENISSLKLPKEEKFVLGKPLNRIYHPIAVGEDFLSQFVEFKEFAVVKS